MSNTTPVSVSQAAWKLWRITVLPLAVGLSAGVAIFNVLTGNYVVANIGNADGSGTAALWGIGIVSFLFGFMAWAFILTVALIIGFIIYALFIPKRADKSSSKPPVQG